MRTKMLACGCSGCLFCDTKRQRKLAGKRRYRERYPERVAEQKRRSYEARKDHYTEKAREWVEANREKSNAIKRAWAERNPEKQREIERKRNARSNRLRKGVPLDAAACEYEEIIRRDPCVYCGGVSSTLDHIVPVTRGGLSNWENLAPACVSCNSSKQNKPLLTFLLGRVVR